MTAKSQNLTRRVFLKQSAAAALLAGGLGAGFSPQVVAQSKSNKRKMLPKPSPMIPPVPAILLTVKGDETVPDEITVVWTFVLNSHPPQIGISVHDDHVALGLIKKHGEFVLNVPTAAMANSFDRVDMNSKKVLDKFELSGLTRGKATKVAAPTIEESPIQVECKVFNTIVMPPVRTLFLAEVLATSVHESACTDDGQLIVANVPFFGMTVGSGEFYTMGKQVGHIGQSVGRDDIKY